MDLILVGMGVRSYDAPTQRYYSAATEYATVGFTAHLLGPKLRLWDSESFKSIYKGPRNENLVDAILRKLQLVKYQMINGP